MNLGIIQGRLSQPIEGFQECPTDWKREFSLLNSLDLNHIEWIITSQNFENNPFFTEDLSNYPISSVCADFMVNDNFCNNEYLNKFLRKTCKFARFNKIKCITIPLLEKSSVSENNTLNKFINAFQPYTKEFNDINFLIEAELPWTIVKKILKLNNNLFLTYDTGNITSCGFDHKEYIKKCISKIKTIHLKDRTKNPVKTVDPFTGDTNFDIIFKTLKDLNFNGNFTIQTARGETGNEIETIKKHKQKFKQLYYEKFI